MKERKNMNLNLLEKKEKNMKDNTENREKRIEQEATRD